MVDASMMASEPLDTNNAESQLLNAEPTNAEPQPSSLVEGGAFETEIASDEMTFDEILDLYDEAKTLQLGDYSEAQFDVVIPKGSELFGQIGPHEVPIPQNNPHHFPPEQPDGSTTKDIGRGMVLGVRDAAKDANELLRDVGSNNILATYIGLPVDMMTKLANIIGFDIQEPVGGSANLKKGLDNFSGWVAENIPGVSEAGEFFSEFTAQKPDSEIVQSLVQGITKFGAGAVSGPVQFVRLLGMKNVILRGFAWGGITDWILGAGKDQTGAGQLIEAIDGLKEDERTGFAEAVYSVLAKQGNDSKYMRRAKATLDGFVAGGIAEGVIKLVTKAAKAVPWKTMLQKSETPVVPEQPALNVPVMKETPAATDLDAQGFFSAVSRAVDALPMDKGSAAQMRAMIAKGEGVKAEEMAWIGLDKFLAGKKSVTKQEVLDYVDANQVRVEEVVLPAKKDLTAESTENYRNNLEEMSDEQLAKESADEFGIDKNDALDAIIDGDREAYIDDLMVEYERFLGQGGGLDVRSTGVAKFGEYTLPGGENYREVLLKLPAKTGAETNAARYDELNQIAARRNLTDAESDEMLAIEQAEFSGTSGTAGDDFVSGHFDEKNVLAHIRLNDRTGPNGERILFIEEIQSDWHQKGRKEGYKRQITDAERSDHKRMQELEAKGSNTTDAERAEYKALTSSHGVRDSHDLAGEYGVPDAPLKKTWHETSFRRVARMAAEEGYDAISWTPGKMQAERYDLSKQISIIHLSGTNFRAYGLDGEVVMGRTGVKPEDLPELIGKEAADRLMSQKPEGNLRSLTGEELEVGGEGMKGFYDQMLKKYAEKWGKKFASKVGVTEIITNPKPLSEYEKQPFIDKAQVWTLPITKKMRDSVLKKGVPLFSAAGAATVTGAAMQGNDNPDL